MILIGVIQTVSQLEIFIHYSSIISTFNTLFLASWDFKANRTHRRFIIIQGIIEISLKKTRA